MNDNIIKTTRPFGPSIANDKMPDDLVEKLNKYIDDISPSSVDEDRNSFFDNLEKNWNYQEVYKNYLEVRLKVYKSINVLYAKNSECLISGYQEISNEQVDEAKKDLDEFVEKYGS